MLVNRQYTCALPRTASQHQRPSLLRRLRAPPPVRAIAPQPQQRPSTPSQPRNNPPARRAAAQRWASARVQRRRYPADAGFDPFGLRKRADRRAFDRMREIEVIHSRWAMLGVLSLIFADLGGAFGGGAGGGGGGAAATTAAPAAAPWLAAALVALLAVGEQRRMAARARERSVESRAYPGGRLAPLRWLVPSPIENSSSSGRKASSSSSGGNGSEASPPPPPAPSAAVWAAWLGGAAGWLAGGWWYREPGTMMTRRELEAMKARELRHGRLAMVSFAGVCAAALANEFQGPVTLLLQHLADPVHHNILGAMWGV